MRTIRISDRTLCATGDAISFTFREKIETAKLLDRLCVSVIELGSMTGDTADNLLIKSVADCVKNSVLAVSPALDAACITRVWDALKTAAHPRLQVCGAVSTARMEYVCHRKPDAMRDAIADAVRACRALCDDVEFIAEDATRADREYLGSVLEVAIAAGATTVTLCDTAGQLLPQELAALLEDVKQRVKWPDSVILGVCCSDALHVANAAAAEAIRVGAGEIKTSVVASDAVSLADLSKLLSVKAEALGIGFPVQTTEINRVLAAIETLSDKSDDDRSPFEDGVRSYPEDIVFTYDDSLETVMKGAARLGYDLDEADTMRVWNVFRDIARKKESVRIGELEAIIASETMQVPATYTLENFVVTTGNAIDILAHVKLRKDGKLYDGLSLGDGPIDAAFLAIEKITGHHYELDDFQLQAVTEGREAMGQTIVKLRSGGKVYAGRGLSTDIIGSGVAAYINALNKILYEEAHA